MASNQLRVNWTCNYYSCCMGQLVDSDYHCSMEERELLAFTVFGTACM